MTPHDTQAYGILTRFNLPSIGFESLVRSKENWLKQRVELFERFCLPSVVAQTDQDFCWLVYFDPQSPDWLLRKIDNWRGYRRFRPVFRREVSLADKRLDITENVPPRQRLISTNLDNDDGLAHDFVARIKAVRVEGPPSAIFIAKGMVLAGERIFLNSDRENAFCSVSEAWNAPVTCWAYPHTDLARHMPHVSLGGQPGWLQVVHGSNVSNRIRGRRVAPGQFHASFSGLQTATDPDLAEKLIDVMIDIPARAARDALRTTLKQTVVWTMGHQGIDRAKSILRL